jgi:DNA-binding XRE family transcriptional regulator
MIMAREPEELVEMRRVLGAQLAAYRRATALSQGQLARATLVDRTTVAHIEKGRSRADERFWTIADRKCRAGGALLTGFRAWETAQQEHEVRTREAQLAEARARADELRAATAPHLRDRVDPLVMPTGAEALARVLTYAGPELAAGLAVPLAYLMFLGSTTTAIPAESRDQIHAQLTTFLRGWADTMNRRELIQLLGWAATTVATTPAMTGLDPDEQERLAKAIATPTRVDNQVIDHLETMLRSCKRQEDTLGPGAVLNTMLAQRNLVHGLLAECPNNLRPRLLSVYSDMSTSIGFYFFDLNDLNSASYYWDQARAAAQNADNVELGVYALGNMSYAASWQGKGHTAIDLAAAARSLVGKTDDPLMKVCAAAEAATGYATDGRHKECMIELERARDGLVSTEGAPPGSPAYWYHEGWLVSRKSECLLRLKKPREALAIASTALTLFDKSYMGSLACCTLRLGNAHLQSREIDEAARVVGDAAGLAAQTRSARLMKELRTTRTRMQPWQSTQAVRVLDDQLAALSMTPSAAV